VPTQSLEDAALTTESPIYELEIMSGEQSGLKKLIVADATIGSAATCTIAISDPAVSSLHARISLKGHGAVVEDAESRNGLFLASNRVQSLVVRDDARFRIGRTTLRLTRVSSRRNDESVDTIGGAVTVSKRMKRVFDSLRQAAKNQAPVLLLGETGCGKEILAQAVHATSPRKSEAFVVVDCGTLSKDLVESELFGHVKGSFTGATKDSLGLLRSAQRGTVFLDEVGELPLEIQTRLLRFLNEGQVRAVGGTAVHEIDVRVIAATHRNLRDMIEAGQFRADLFYRLSALVIEIPPLRERPEDIELLVKKALANKGQGDFEVTPELLAQLMAHQWPGNVRELNNVVEQVLAGTHAMLLDRNEAAQDDGFRGAKNQLLDAFTRQYFQSVYEKANGNVSEIARLSKMNRTWVHELLTRLGVHKLK
jgi:two-component system, NtrC family, response regulator GlrR